MVCSTCINIEGLFDLYKYMMAGMEGFKSLEYIVSSFKSLEDTLRANNKHNYNLAHTIL